MKDHLRFSVVYWHTFANPLSDPFGPGTAIRPWDEGADGMARARTRVKVAFEFFEKLGVPFFAFHDRDVAPEGSTLKESHANLDEVVKAAQGRDGPDRRQAALGDREPLLEPPLRPRRPPAPTSTSSPTPRPRSRRRMEVTVDLGGLGYTFWGGREGYSTLWNTDMKREVDHLGRFLHMAVDYKKQIGFRPVLHRAQAQGADQAPVRLRRRRLPQLPPDLRPAAPLQAQPRDQPRHPGRPRDDARDARGDRLRGARLARRQHRRPPDRLGHRPVPDRHLPDHQVHALRPRDGRADHRRRQLRRQGPPRELRAGRPLPRPHRRDGRLRPRPEDRPRDHRRRPTPGFVKDRYKSWDGELGRRSRPARRASPTSKPTSCPRARSPPTPAAGRRCSRT